MGQVRTRKRCYRVTHLAFMTAFVDSILYSPDIILTNTSIELNRPAFSSKVSKLSSSISCERIFAFGRYTVITLFVSSTSAVMSVISIPALIVPSHLAMKEFELAHGFV